MKPVKSDLITIKKCEQLENRLLIAVDGGNVFTKILFLNKTNSKQLLNEDESLLIMDFQIFYTEDFRHAIEWIRDNAYIPEDDSHGVHITGSYAIQHQNEVKLILNRDLHYIEKFRTIAIGCQFALNHIGIDSLLAKPVDFTPHGQTDSAMIKRMIDAMKSKMPVTEYATDGMHPCAFYVHGSNSAFYCFDENGSCEYFQLPSSGNHTLLGLSKCLTNGNRFNDIVELASKGNKNYVDTQIKELVDENIDSPYGKFPLEMPVFSFGKCMDYDIGLEVLRKEDISNSLVYFSIINIVLASWFICSSRRVSKVYICGDLFETEWFRKEYQNVINIPFLLNNSMILDFDYSAVLGAMLFDVENDKQYLEISKISLF